MDMPQELTDLERLMACLSQIDSSSPKMPHVCMRQNLDLRVCQRREISNFSVSNLEDCTRSVLVRQELTQ